MSFYYILFVFLWPLQKSFLRHKPFSELIIDVKTVRIPPFPFLNRRFLQRKRFHLCSFYPHTSPVGPRQGPRPGPYTLPLRLDFSPPVSCHLKSRVRNQCELNHFSSPRKHVTDFSSFYVCQWRICKCCTQGPNCPSFDLHNSQKGEIKGEEGEWGNGVRLIQGYISLDLIALGISGSIGLVLDAPVGT